METLAGAVRTVQNVEMTQKEMRRPMGTQGGSYNGSDDETSPADVRRERGKVTFGGETSGLTAATTRALLDDDEIATGDGG